MQHVFEFILDHNVETEEGSSINRVHEYYITQSSRKTKVAKKILKEKGITINNVENFQLRKIR